MIASLTGLQFGMEDRTRPVLQPDSEYRPRMRELTVRRSIVLSLLSRRSLVLRAKGLLVAALLSVIGTAHAQTPLPTPTGPTLERIVERGELRVGLEAGYMPFEVRDRAGDIIGFDVDFARLMAHRLGVRLRLVNTQWDGIIPSLLTDKFDILMSGMTITDARAQTVAFCDPYIVIGQTVLLNPRLKDTITSYQQLDDPKYVVATKLGVTGEIAARQYMGHAQIRTFETESDGVTEVRNNRADAFVYDLPYNAIYAAQNPGSVILLEPPFTQEPLGWAVRKGDADLVAWVNAFLARTHEDGSYDALYTKWFINGAWLRRLE